jgi:hypothetical protein
VRVRAAIEHLDTVPEVSDEDRREAFNNIKKAADFYHVEICGDTYEDMCRRPQSEILPRD